MTDKKFYKYTYEITVLSEEPRAFDSLEDIHYEIMDGDCVGTWGEKSRKELTGKQMAKELYKVGSEPGFFRLDDEGRKVDDEDEED